MGVAFITGAGIRIGRSVALQLAQAGFDVALHANSNAASLEDAAKDVRALGRKAWLYQADLSDPAAVDALGRRVLAAHPVLDVVVHNAGVFERVAFKDITRAQHRRMQAINVDAPFFLSQALLPALQAAATPSIIHIGDVAGERPLSRYAHYSVSKAALLMLTRALAVELAPHIRVNAVSPGTVAFPPDFDADARARILARIPMHQEGSVEDIAKTVLFLVRDAPYVTGQVWNVDGGRSSAL